MVNTCSYICTDLPRNPNISYLKVIFDISLPSLGTIELPCIIPHPLLQRQSKTLPWLLRLVLEMPQLRGNKWAVKLGLLKDESCPPFLFGMCAVLRRTNQIWVHRV